MRVLDHIRQAKNWEVRIPMYHRGHLSLYPRTTIHLAPVLRDDRPDYFVELLGTTIQPNAWSRVYRVSISLQDAPGVLHATLDSIAQHGGNVLHLDSTSTDKEQIHEVEMVVDFAAQRDLGKTAHDTIAAIEGFLLADCYKHVLEYSGRGGGWAVRVNPIASLLRVAEIRSEFRSPVFDDISARLQIGEKGKLDLRPLENLINATMSSDEKVEHRPTRKLGPTFRYFVTSDTRDRVFRLFLLPDGEVVVWCAISHDDERGALSAITDEIRKKNISILTALNRVQRHQRRNWFEVVLSSPRWRSYADREREQKALKDVQRALSSKTLFPFQVKCYFTKSEADTAMRESIEERPSSMTRLRPQVKLDEWLRQQEEALKTVRADGHPDPREAVDSEDPVWLALRQREALRCGIERVRRATRRISPVIFLSIEFTNENKLRIESIRRVCNEHKVTLDVVSGSNQRDIIRDEVLVRIEAATHFLCVWTPSPKNALGGKRPSPWCLWELGVANALKKPFRALIQEGTETVDIENLHGECFYDVFPTDPASKFDNLVDGIIRAWCQPQLMRRP